MDMTTSNPLTERQQAFLNAYRYSGMVKEAAAEAGCSRELHYNALRTSEAYREAFAVLQQVLAFELEEEARRRAVDGVKIPVVYRGKVIGYDTRYSDNLLVFLLEANHPEKFAGIRRELSNSQDGFCVRWDREEVGRPTLPRMTGPMPPMPPQPPRPPQPPAAFWLQAAGGDESAETPPDTEARTPPDPAVIARWATNPIFEPLESPWDAALMQDPSSDHPFAQRPEEIPPEIEDPESEDSNDGFCVRSTDEDFDWDEPTPDPDAHDGWDGSVDSTSDVMAQGVPGSRRPGACPQRKLFDRSTSLAFGPQVPPSGNLGHPAETATPVSVSGGRRPSRTGRRTDRPFRPRGTSGGEGPGPVGLAGRLDGLSGRRSGWIARGCWRAGPLFGGARDRTPDGTQQQWDGFLERSASGEAGPPPGPAPAPQQSSPSPVTKERPAPFDHALLRACHSAP
jgi:hypothetical protein